MVLDTRATQILRVEGEIKELRATLELPFKNDPVVATYQSIRGIGRATAITLGLYLGDCRPFYSPNAAVASFGLDPKIRDSGDQQSRMKISKRGWARVRGLLWNSALVSIREEGRFRDFYARLLAVGKKKSVAIVAVMAKIVRVAYACQMKQTPFDLDYPLPEVPLRGSAKSRQAVSKREAKRRKKQQTPTSEVMPQETVVVSCLS